MAREGTLTMVIETIYTIMFLVSLQVVFGFGFSGWLRFEMDMYWICYLMMVVVVGLVTLKYMLSSWSFTLWNLWFEVVPGFSVGLILATISPEKVGVFVLLVWLICYVGYMVFSIRFDYIWGTNFRNYLWRGYRV